MAWCAESRSTSSASPPSRTARSTCWRVTSSRSPMNGRATCLSPWPRGASDATSQRRRPTVKRPSAPRSRAPQAMSRPASRRVELVGIPLRRASSPSVSDRWPASKAASSANARSTTGSPCGGRRPRTRAGSGDAPVTVVTPGVHGEARTTVVFHWLALCLTSHQAGPHRCRQAGPMPWPGRSSGRSPTLSVDVRRSQQTMNRFITRSGAAVVAAVAATSLAACSGGSGGGSSASASDTVTVALNADASPSGYDPLLYSQGQFQFFSSLYDALFVTDADGKVQPSLVTDFSNSPDNLQTTLKLKEGVTFTDGSTLDSTLVKANLDARSNTDLLINGTLGAGGSQEITDVSAPDPQTVVITWKAPQAQGQNALADTNGVIVGKDAVTNRDSLATKPDGSGAYTLNSGKTTK